MSTSTYDLETLLPFVRASLQNTLKLEYRDFLQAVWQKLEDAGFPGVLRSQQPNFGCDFEYDNSPYELRSAASQAFLYLIYRGYIAPEPPDGYLNFSQATRYDVTARGREWFNGREPYPEESRGYLELLNKLVGVLDPIIEQYVVEALTAFQREAHFAAAVMLGAASEKAIYLLANAMVGAVTDPPKKKKLQTLSDSRSLLKLLELVRDYIQNAGDAKLIPYSHFEGSASHLMSLFEAIRVQRNDAVHPKNAIVSAGSVRHSLKAFPHALRKSEDLRNWFFANPNSI